jgi:hypothetical protein
MATKPAPRRRPPGSLRLTTKTAKGKTYTRWQWRTHRPTDTGWATVDVELGQDLRNQRVRVLVALGELSAPLLIERWVRWRFRHWDPLPAWCGRPDAAKDRQRAAWWIELPRADQKNHPVRVRFRSLDGSLDFRRARRNIVETEQIAADLWSCLVDDPILELARLQWLEREAQQQIDAIAQEQIDLRRLRRIGELSQRDYEADERSAYLRLDGWESMASAVRCGWDELLAELVAAMPRPRREADRTRIVALAARHLSDPRRLRQWHADHWDENTLRW